MVIDLLNPGGAQRQFVGLAKLLKEKGYYVRIIYYEDYAFYKPFLDKNQIEHILLSSNSNKLFHYPSVYKQIKQQITSYNPDVVISYLRIPSIICSFIHRNNRNFKLIVSERNTTQILDWLERLKFWSFRWADVIVPNSRSQEQFIKEHYPQYTNITHTITNFVDTNYFCPIAQVEITTHNRLEILCVGRIDKQKNIPAFLKALKIVKEKGFEFHVSWYGKSFGSYSDACRHQVFDDNLSGYFDFYGASNNIRDIYQRTDIFCLPSLYEGFPNVICEAMSCGVPILASNVCDNPDIVTPECGILFNPTNVDNIAECIIEMLTKTDEQRTAMGVAARKRSVGLFRSDVFLNKYEECFG